MSSYTFQGYRRANGKFGARNLVAVIPSVICANDVGQAICRQVQGTIGYFHHQGCCQLPDSPGYSPACGQCGQL